MELCRPTRRARSARIAGAALGVMLASCRATPAGPNALPGERAGERADAGARMPTVVLGAASAQPAEDASAAAADRAPLGTVHGAAFIAPLELAGRAPFAPYLPERPHIRPDPADRSLEELESLRAALGVAAPSAPARPRLALGIADASALLADGARREAAELEARIAAGDATRGDLAPRIERAAHAALAFETVAANHYALLLAEHAGFCAGARRCADDFAWRLAWIELGRERARAAREALAVIPRAAPQSGLALDATVLDALLQSALAQAPDALRSAAARLDALAASAEMRGPSQPSTARFALFVAYARAELAHRTGADDVARSLLEELVRAAHRDPAAPGAGWLEPSAGALLADRPTPPKPPR